MFLEPNKSWHQVIINRFSCYISCQTYKSSSLDIWSSCLFCLNSTSVILSFWSEMSFLTWSCYIYRFLEDFPWYLLEENLSFPLSNLMNCWTNYIRFMVVYRPFQSFHGHLTVALRSLHGLFKVFSVFSRFSRFLRFFHGVFTVFSYEISSFELNAKGMKNYLIFFCFIVGYFYGGIWKTS